MQYSEISDKFGFSPFAFLQSGLDLLNADKYPV